MPPNPIAADREGTGVSEVLQVRSVSKAFPIYRNPAHRFLRTLFGRLVPSPRLFHALRDVDLDVRQGDAVAILGRNGAGKSTLLQIICGVLKPTTGHVATPKRVLGLLELGSGFNPDFTGRQNVFLNGAILGMTRKEIANNLPGIIDFAEIGDFIDQPVKTYSSGMFLRLAFSVAVHLHPDLLVVDEALTVGDVFFRQKCYERLQQLRERGMALLLVTHSLTDAAEVCNRGAVLSEGEMVFSGTGRDAVQYFLHYERETPTGNFRREKRTVKDSQVGPVESAPADMPITLPADADAIDLRHRKFYGPGHVKALRMLAGGADGQRRHIFYQGETLLVQVEFEIRTAVECPLMGIGLINERGVLVHGRNTLQFEYTPPALTADGILLCTHQVKLLLEPGEYTIDVGFADVPRELFLQRHRLSPQEITSHIRMLYHLVQAGAITIILPTIARPHVCSHYGVANLPCEQTMAFMPEPDGM